MSTSLRFRTRAGTSFAGRTRLSSFRRSGCAVSTVIVVPMTSAARSAAELPPYLVAVTAKESGLDRDGFVKADQPATLPVGVLGPRARAGPRPR